MGTLGFGWEGALVGFLTFNAVKGVDIMMKAYRSLYENYVSTPEGDASIEGKAHVLNYLIQVVTITGGGGYVARKREVSHIGMSPNVFNHRKIAPLTGIDLRPLDWALLFIIAVTLLWDHMFPNAPLMNQSCMCIMSGPSHRRREQHGASQARSTTREVKT